MSTRFPGDLRTATEVLSLDLDPTGTIRGTLDAGPRPLWAIGVAEVTAARHGTVISLGLTEPERKAWAERLDRASATVAGSGVVASPDQRPLGLVLEIPSEVADFASVTSASDASAITSCTTGTPRIAINPIANSQGEDYLDATVIHEAVHVASNSPCLKGTAWVVEGMAESVAAAADPATARGNARLVQRTLSDRGQPQSLPSALVTQTDYALAQVAADQVRAHLGTKAAEFFTRGVSGGLSAADQAAATKWYLAELRRRS